MAIFFISSCQGFSFPISRGRCIGDPPQEDLAKFGYISTKKVVLKKKKQKPCYGYTGDLQEPLV
jgi:hypothetical protein